MADVEGGHLKGRWRDVQDVGVHGEYDFGDALEDILGADVIDLIGPSHYFTAGIGGGVVVNDGGRVEGLQFDGFFAKYKGGSGENEESF